MAGPNPCWPNIAENGAREGDLLGNECPACGHLVAMHSRSRGCAACEMLTKLTPGLIGQIDSAAKEAQL